MTLVVFMKERLVNIPLEAGVYLFKDQDGEVIYVGKAKVLRNRVRSYFQKSESLHPKVRAMMAKVVDLDYIVSSSEMEALILESNLIKSYQPRYNIDLRDDKSYPYLKITLNEKYPRMQIVREKKDKVSRYFGPYTDVTSLRETVRLLKSIVLLRSCKNFRFQDRACLNHDIGKCMGPCIQQVSPEDYLKQVKLLIDFLEGNDKDILSRKKAEMLKASADLEFEKAARIRDEIESVKKLAEKQKVVLESPYDMDVIAMIHADKENLLLIFKIRAGKIIAKESYWLKKAIDETEAEVLAFFIKQYYVQQNDIPKEIIMQTIPADIELLELCLEDLSGKKISIKIPQRGEKRSILDILAENARLLWEEKMKDEIEVNKILHELSKVLNIEAIPRRIECFDISHLGGEETVASMVVFSQGKKDKKAYRRFKIKDDVNDDYQSLAEAVKRRFIQAKQGNESFLPEPDLLLIDGGLGQVNSVKKILDELGVDVNVFALAKKNEELFSPGNPHPLRLDRRHEGLKLLQRVRDEAHRFAVEYNRLRRAKKLSISELDNIKGVGVKRKSALLKHFGSVERIKQASLDDIISVDGIDQKTAKLVYQYFKVGNES